MVELYEGEQAREKTKIRSSTGPDTKKLYFSWLKYFLIDLFLLQKSDKQDGMKIWSFLTFFSFPILE